MMQDLRRWSDHYGVPLRLPPNDVPFPINSLLPMRAAVAAVIRGSGDAFCHSVFRAYWADGRDVSIPDEVAKVAAAIGLDAKALLDAASTQEVKDKLRKSAMELSGGQQQRLCIARAIATEPSVLLMDEPASALDPISTTKIEELIYELKSNYTIIIVTHNMQQAGRVSDKTAFYYLGELVEFDSTKKVFTNPEQIKTQDYITGRFG